MLYCLSLATLMALACSFNVDGSSTNTQETSTWQLLQDRFNERKGLKWYQGVKEAVEREIEFRKTNPPNAESGGKYSRATGTTDEILETELSSLDKAIKNSEDRLMDPKYNAPVFTAMKLTPPLLLLALASFGAYKYYQYRKKKASLSQADKQETEINNSQNDSKSN